MLSRVNTHFIETRLSSVTMSRPSIQIVGTAFGLDHGSTCRLEVVRETVKDSKKVLVEAAYTLVRMAVRFETLGSRDDRPWKGDIKLTWKNAYGCKVALFSGTVESG